MIWLLWTLVIGLVIWTAYLSYMTARNATIIDLTFWKINAELKSARERIRNLESKSQ